MRGGVIILDYFVGSDVIRRVRIRRKRVSVRVRGRLEDAMLLALKVDTGTRSQGVGQPLEAEQGEKADSSLEPPEGMQRCQRFAFGQ